MQINELDVAELADGLAVREEEGADEGVEEDGEEEVDPIRDLVHSLVCIV